MIEPLSWLSHTNAKLSKNSCVKPNHAFVIYIPCGVLSSIEGVSHSLLHSWDDVVTKLTSTKGFQL